MKGQYKTLFLYQILFWSIAYASLSFFKFFDLNELVSSYAGTVPQNGILFLILGMSTVAGVVQGALFACLDVVLDRRLKAKRSFLAFVVRRTIAYSIVIVAILVLTVLVRGLIVPVSESEAGSLSIRAFFNRIVLTYMIYALVMSFAASFLYQIFLNIGPHVFVPMLLGRYYTPVVEDRIFMFLDLESSTTHAEKLGHVLFSRLIQDCFFDLNRSVVKYRAQVDQYIGDEATVTWSTNGKAGNRVALDFYYDYAEQLARRREYYLKRYGLIPTFKASVNCGEVTAAEIGVSKRSIAYHGDVLNTAARIQGECGRLGRSFLISGSFHSLVSDCPGYRFERIGTLHLKGKTSETEVFAVERPGSGPGV